ncbi:alkaline phosphatase family protein [Vitiosangium sp. GDMCC 1.1324]|uniref:alkaline phosphatase family protein n=1 Tax=Vitiosangium sp. (strain GDMCC 1.1324) TaxID=2138576 RepID=UPI000D33D0A7|nr:alkaline phosphatase family protein [Vitiosangium sp. GDMCC 1.1324]PTL78923.1 hypothetical protein DAT35_35430 [Vitiosangium sp. GDMCC 1.1324]
MSSGPRILLIAERFPPDLGGLARSGARTADALSRLDAQVDVLTWTRTLPPGALQTLDAGEVAASARGATLHRLGLFGQTDTSLQHTLDVLDYLHSQRRYKLVWGHYLSPPGFLAVTFAGLAGIPSTVSARGNDVDQAMFPPGDFARLLWTLQRATVLTAASGDLARKQHHSDWLELDGCISAAPTQTATGGHGRDPGLSQPRPGSVEEFLSGAPLPLAPQGRAADIQNRTQHQVASGRGLMREKQSERLPSGHAHGHSQCSRRGGVMATLNQIEHIVVLMLENRSFDHMLGYLMTDGNPLPVNGLTKGEVNTFNGTPYKPLPLDQPVFRYDPHHDYDAVAEQISDQHGGFVKSFAKSLQGKTGVPIDAVMGYYDKRQVPVYDNLARQYAVCDRWFASVPGPTWPNRFFAMCGHSNGEVRNGHIQDIRTIFEYLDAEQVSWRYYSHDIAFLRTVRRYTGSMDVIEKVSKFYQAASAGNLPAVSWIDPNFTIQEALFGWGYSNDDHPPADVRRGQQLVSRIYNTLLLGRNDLWKKTLFIVLYDEHGGFYDHVIPRDNERATPPNNRNPEKFMRYGVRVPALVMSPYIEAGTVSHTTYDHTSVLKTILRRFCTQPSGNIPHMSDRVNAAANLESLLTRSTPRTDCKPAPVVNVAEIAVVPLQFKSAQGVDHAHVVAAAGSGAGGPVTIDSVALEPTDMQREMLWLREQALAEGVPEDKL